MALVPVLLDEKIRAADAGGVTTESFDVTVPTGSDQILLVMASGGGPGTSTVVGVTLGATPLTLAVQSTGPYSSSGQIWYLVNPPAGLATVTISAGSSIYFQGQYRAWIVSGVDTSDPIAAVDKDNFNATSTSKPIATPAGGVAVAVFGVGAGATSIAVTPSGTFLGAAGTWSTGRTGRAAYLADATAMGFSWSGGALQGGMAVAALRPKSSGATGPTINTQPSAQSAVAPATATFSVAATASGGTLSYQWQREPAAGGGFSNISGATSSSYTTGATTVSGGSHNNGDKYRCAVTDANGTTNSAQAVLTVTASASGPSITTQPSNQSVVSPATATFTVAATTSGGALSYQWQRQPSGGGGYTNIGGATSASYTTGATSVTGGGHSNGDTYRCNVSDSNGTTASSAATLTVSAASGSITTEVMVNNTGTPQASKSVYWSWLPGARIGSLASVAAQDGTGTTTAAGRLTATGLPAGQGVLMVAVRGATVAEDAVYWQTGTVA